MKIICKRQYNLLCLLMLCHHRMLIENQMFVIEKMRVCNVINARHGSLLTASDLHTNFPVTFGC